MHYNFMPYISGTTRAKLTQGQLNAAKLVIPPLDLQVDFSRRVGLVGKLKSAHETSLAEMDALFAALQHRAFRGEL
jgi:type I restriction enzyme S subunit